MQTNNTSRRSILALSAAVLARPLSVGAGDEPGHRHRHAGRARPDGARLVVDEVFGRRKQAQKKHFDDGGEFDKIYQSK